MRVLLEWLLRRHGLYAYSKAELHIAAQLAFNAGRTVGENETANKFAELLRGLGFEVQVVTPEEAEAMHEKQTASLN